MSGNVQYLYIGNENEPLSQLNGYESGSFTIGKDIPGDPAYGCSKNFVSTYMCGDKLKSINMEGEAGGKQAVYDCSDEVNKCNNNPAFATMKNNGNFLIYKGHDQTDKGPHKWNTKTWGKMSGSTGTNLINGGKTILKAGEILTVGEKLVNPNKNGFVEIQSDGTVRVINRALNQSKDKQGNIVGISDTPGDPSVALYEINPKKPSKNLFKTGYVDIDGDLHAYPNNMTEYKDSYNVIQNTNAPGYDIASLGVIGQPACEQNCNARTDCGVYQTDSAGTCWLKSEDAYTKGNVVDSPGMNTHLRMKGPLQHKYEYKNYQGKDSGGHDIRCTQPNEVKTKDQMQNLCDKDPKCAAYNWVDNEKFGCLKNKTAYSDGNKDSNFSPNNKVDYNVKLTSGGTSSFLGSCSQDVVGINSGRWDAYVKGNDMTRNTKCGLARITEKDQIELAASEKILNGLSQKMKTNINKLTSKEDKLNKYYVNYYNKMEKELKKFKKGYSAYKKDKAEIANIDAWNDDSEIQLISYNSTYTIFSIIAIIMVGILVKMNKK